MYDRAREIVGGGDFDGDGRGDLLVRLRGSPQLSLWRMNGRVAEEQLAIGELVDGWHPAGVGDESPSTQRWSK